MGISMSGKFEGGLLAAAMLTLSLLSSASLQAQNNETDVKFEWVPPAASNTQQEVDPSVKRLEITITPTPKKTADVSKFTRRQVLDLAKFNISNDGTNPVETSKGINAAIQDAYKNGANYIVFPRGTYLISENDPILLNIKNAIVDLNGATLQINTNKLRKYITVSITFGAQNLRLTNGTLRGDKDTHDYTDGGEWGSGLRVESGSEIEIDHMTFANFMGDGVVTENGMLGEDRYHYVKTTNLQQGGFSEDGKPVQSTSKTRTVEPYDITPAQGAFEFGFTAEYMGFPYVKSRAYQAYFYTDDMKFISKSINYQYRKAQVPAGAKWIHLEFNQPEVLGAPVSVYTGQKDYCGFLSNFKSPVDVHFHDNHAIGNRRLGMAYCGGQRWVIEDNLFEGNGGTAPGFGVDFEDGWLMMQDVVFRNNKFKDNIRGDLVVCAGSELLFEGNEFEKGAHFWDATLSYTFQNNVIKGGGVSFKTRTGHVTAQDNHYENCTILIRYDPRGINNGVYMGEGELPNTQPVRLERETLLNIKSVTGTYFDFLDSKLTNVSIFAGKETQLVRINNSELNNTQVNYSKDGPGVVSQAEGNKGTLEETGPGLARKQQSN